MDNWIPTLVQVKAFLSAAGHDCTSVAGVLQPVLKKTGLVMLGGSLGAALRYAAGLLAVRLWGSHFPWGTLLVNLTGCFLIGLLFALAERVRLLTPDLRLFLITGFLGALTTFSSFSLETVNTARAGMVVQPLINILLNNALGLALTFLGMRLGGFR
jgi:CrcB protein